MAAFSIDRSTTALLIADFYAEAMGSLPHAVERGVVERTVGLQTAARDAGLMVCYCATVFRPGYPEISDRKQDVSARVRRRVSRPFFDPVALIHPAVRPRDGEVVVGKTSGETPCSGPAWTWRSPGKQHRHDHPAGFTPPAASCCPTTRLRG